MNNRDWIYVLQVQNLLQQMQDKFQTMSDQIIARNILYVDHCINYIYITLVNKFLQVLLLQ